VVNGEVKWGKSGFFNGEELTQIAAGKSNVIGIMFYLNRKRLNISKILECIKKYYICSMF
jgi:hypothetical protein